MGNGTRVYSWAIAVCALVLTARGVAAQSLPSPWTSQDVGAVGLAGSASYVGDAYTVRGSGGDIWGGADAFQAVMQPVVGDVQIVVRVTSLQNTNTYAKAGVMLRAGSAEIG